MQHNAISSTRDLKLILAHSAPVRSLHLGELPVRDGVLTDEQLKPPDRDGFEAVRFATQRSVDPVLSSPEEPAVTLDRYYNHRDENEALEQFKLGPAANVPEPPRSVRLIEQEAQLRPVVRLLNSILLQTVMADASDVNIRPGKDHVAFYCRIDGKLRFMRRLGPALLPPLVARIKVIARMDVAGHRLPQDGHARLQPKDRQIDLASPWCPPARAKAWYCASWTARWHCGRSANSASPTRKWTACAGCRGTSGMLPVTGPTGSGKWTTLHAIPHEMRDVETTRIAIRAALTGHRVLSTLHTNSAARTITRLLDMGVEPYLRGTALNSLLKKAIHGLFQPAKRKVRPFTLPGRFATFFRHIRRV